MAVQAQHPSSIVVDLRNRMNQVFGPEGTGLCSYFPDGLSLLKDYDASGAGGNASQQLLFHSMVDPVAFLERSGAELSQQPHPSRKRARKSAHTSTQGHYSHALCLGELHAVRDSSPMSQTNALVSTGLRLALDNELLKASATATGRFELGSTLSCLSEDISSQLLQQREEVNQFLIKQLEHLRNTLEEKMQKHSTAFLLTVEECVSRRLGERELELEDLNRTTIELEERVRLLSVEARRWRTKAKSNEALMLALRSNLQQVFAQGREQSKEGSGDSAADDAESAHYDVNAPLHNRALRSIKNRYKELTRTCKICEAKEVSVLLLPCRHLCLCKDCQGPVERCPLCLCVKCASVEVYMS